jgi:NADPH-dependent glutamate synthase beta subunit-like oxidoreductase
MDEFNTLFGIPYLLLREARGIQQLDQIFCDWLAMEYPSKAVELTNFRDSRFEDVHYENWLVNFAPCVAEFLTSGFVEIKEPLDAFRKQALQDETASHFPVRLNLNELIQTERYDGYRLIEKNKRRFRQGFNLTDLGMSDTEKKNEAHYCLYCHDKQGDFCSRGFPVKKNEKPMQWRKHITGEWMLGCPVEEKISQMHQLYASGDLLAAFAVVMVDNPLCALTGHRICNDCMKSCIYQKKNPVNTPEVETGIVLKVLELPWGVEIYDILMRWNPMRREQALEQPYNGKKVWVMGLGPAGISAVHHLLMAGCGVVAADGLRIQPLPESWCDVPIRNWSMISEPLSTRPLRGFGGVAEYGITARWNKNFLTLIQLLFQRRPYLSVLGDVRFGGTITLADVWELGFDHLCLAVGAGLSRELAIPGSLAPGMRQANDFLMALQLTGAGRPHSQFALQIRLPAVVIGGGLTAVDTATEVQAYYIQQIEEVERRFRKLVKSAGEEKAWELFDEIDRACLEEWLFHAAAWDKYKKENTPIDTASFLHRYGGVCIVYRKRMEDSPAYRHNHEELEKALQEGLHYRECLEPIAAICDETGAVVSMRFLRQEKTQEGWCSTSDELILPARSVLCATGSTPNVAYEFEHPGTFLKKNKSYRPHRFSKDHLILEEREEGHCKSSQIGMLTSYKEGEHRVSLLGDAHPWFHGSVVKAIASGKIALPQILASINRASFTHDFQVMKAEIVDKFTPYLEAIHPISETVSQWVIRAPWLVKQHQPGQFYRVGNRINPTQEPLALLGSVDKVYPDCLVFWVEGRTLLMGTDMSVMGPTGVWTKLGSDKQETMVVIGGFLAAVYLRSVAPAWKTHGHRVIWLNTSDANFTREQLLESVDEITQENWIDAMLKYPDVTAVHAIGDKELLCQVQSARANAWKNNLKDDVYWVGSTYGPMQCMLKGVCAQCLQWQVDPTTGKRKKAVYACSWQHQPMDLIDLNHLEQRQRLSSTYTKLITYSTRYSQRN